MKELGDRIEAAVVHMQEHSSDNDANANEMWLWLRGRRD